MKKMFLVFNHNLTNEQRLDAVKTLNVKEFVEMPDELKNKWSNIDPSAEKVDIADIEEWLYANTNESDIVLIQGEQGATCKLVKFAKNINIIPMYATSKRESVEVENNGEIIKKSIFKHVRYREYE